MSSWEEERRVQEVRDEDKRKAEERRAKMQSPFERALEAARTVKRCPHCGTEFFERVLDECCPKCGSSAAEKRRPAQTFWALVGIATESSKTSEDDVLTQLRKMKNVKEAHAVFPLVLACEGALANIAAIVATETQDELKMVLSNLRQIQEVRSMLMQLASSESEATRMLEAVRFPKKSGKPVLPQNLGCC